MSTKHTPGPWDWTGVFVEADGNVVASVEWDNDANARLIAAAPELLEALKRLLDCPILRNGEFLCLEIDAAARQADAAIAKATGEPSK